MLYIDVTKTMKEGTLTGIQRVVIEYLKELRKLTPVHPVRRVGNAYVNLAQHQIKELLERGSKDKPRQERRSLFDFMRVESPSDFFKIFGGGSRRAAPQIIREDILFVPEVFEEDAPRAMGGFGKKIAMVHDIAAVTRPEWSSEKTRKNFPKYLRQVAEFDWVVTPSIDTKNQLDSWWKANHVSPIARVKVIEHGVGAVERQKNIPEKRRLLCLGSLEARKNQINLLKACENLWNDGRGFELVLVGARAGSGKDAERLIKEFQKRKLPLVWRGALSDTEMEDEWQKAWALVYPSFEEGFGLPVAEALARGVPVICGIGGALKERTAQGGCESLREVNVEGLYFGVENVLRGERREVLAAEARGIKPRGWGEAAGELVDLVGL